MADNGRMKRTDAATIQRVLDWKAALKWVSALTVLVVVGGSVAWGVTLLRDPAVLPLKIVRIDGDFKNLNRRTLEQAVSQAIVGNFFTVDLDRVRAEALKLAWVDQVTVRRIWPGTLNMWVEEQKPLARWGSNQLVNARGAVFTPEAASLKSDLPWLDGPEEQAVEVVERFKQMGSRLAPLDLAIARIVMDGRGAWTVEFTQGVELKLGNKDTEGRVTRFVQLYPRLEQNDVRKVKRVDMRYANGVAVLWGEAS
ncbi:MAG: cell division protein FtsQ/DivIB [Sedimenticola sp.]|uniref:Cell division protein FtsQ n=1 Tax=Sedimenticola thiotaurini TaxID=1543721 RepID=A0A558DC40_9GAMM|nr:cell division protein FtsQ/DivIB [Sedimenticola sp.]TVT58546.1 MAG: FtsQ-type POTRA domain-containing protein [Sedimenticola thiotaurini]